MSETKAIQWRKLSVKSPHIDKPVEVIAAKYVPYKQEANRLENLSIYLRETPETLKLLGTSVTFIPGKSDGKVPSWHVHIHGGAWRDPLQDCSSIEAAVAHAFSPDNGSSHPITAIISLDYTITQFPTHPTMPYTTATANHSDPAREAVHPDHVRNIFQAFTLLRTLGLTDGSYILSGHSCGACLAFQTILKGPADWGFGSEFEDAPAPAALLGLNGLYDLPNLVHALGDSHVHLVDVYTMLLDNAFGSDQSTWPGASPSRVDVEKLTERLVARKIPHLVVLDQSTKDQLVPINQTVTMGAHLKKVTGLDVVDGKRCTGVHAAPWEQGYMIWEDILDIVALLKGDS